MTFAVDIATRTVILTEKADVDLINSVVKEPIPYSELAQMFAEEAMGTEMDGEWAFGATTAEVAEYLRSFTTGATDLVEMTVGGKGALH